MPLTRAYCEKVAVKRVGAKSLQLIEMAYTFVQGQPNDDLNDPIATALDHFKVVPADITNIVDSDLAQLPADLQVRYLDYLEIQVLQTMQNHLAARPQILQYKDGKTDWGTQFREDLTNTLASRVAAYTRKYLNSAAPAVGSLCPAVEHQLDYERYFPPFVGRPWPPLPPDALGQ